MMTSNRRRDDRRRHHAGRGRSGLLAAVAALAILLAGCLPPSGQLRLPGLQHMPPPPLARLDHGLAAVAGPLPFPFEMNVGQAGPDAAFLLRAGDLTVGFGAGTLTYALQAVEPEEMPARSARVRTADTPGPAARRWTVQQELVGARPAAPVGTVAAGTAVSYFVGPPETWKRGVPAYHQLAYAEPWPGVLVTYDRDRTGLKSTYHLAPGADSGAIRLAYRGGEVSVAEDGALEIATPLGVLRESAPVAWQELDGRRTAVSVAWEVVSAPGTEEAEVGFRVGGYDRSRDLVIDPSLLYVTYLGGSGSNDVGVAVAVDGSGAAYVTGFTDSTQATFPDGDPNGNGQIDAPGFDRNHNGGIDAFVAKLAPDGRSLAYLTYIGGSAADAGEDIAVDAAGAAYVVGTTSSTEATFPTGGGFVPGFDQSQNGSADVFVVKLAPDGQSLLYATYIGGNLAENGRAITVDAAGAAYVLGDTRSDQTTFPDGDPNGDNQMNVAGSDQTHNGDFDAFVVRLSPDGRSLDFATYVGGDQQDLGFDIAVDASRAAYIAGRTLSDAASFPDGDGFGAVPGFDRTDNGAFDAFVVKLAPDGRSLVHASYLGGLADDVALGIALDAAGAAYVTGQTPSNQATFPNGTGLGGLGLPGFDQTHNGNIDAFVIKLAPNGLSLVYATFLGGSSDDGGFGVAVDASGAAYVGGATLSTETSFPDGDPDDDDQMEVPGFDQAHNGGPQDSFVVKLAPGGQGLVYATYIGGSGIESGEVGIAVDGNGAAYVTSRTTSTQATFPDGDGFGGANPAPGFDQAHNGGVDAYVAKIDPQPASTPAPTATPAPTSTPATPTPVPGNCAPRPNVKVTTAKAGPGQLSATVAAQTSPTTPSNTLKSLRITSLANVRVLFGGAQLAAGQTVQLPAGTQQAVLTVQRIAAGQAGTAQLVVTDACGEWPTFVGGGPNAF